MSHNLDTVSRFYLFARRTPNNASHLKVGIYVEFETRESFFATVDLGSGTDRLPYEWVIQFDMSYGLLIDVLREIREAIKSYVVEVEDALSMYRSDLPLETVLEVFRQNDLMSEDDFPFFHIWTEGATKAWQDRIQPLNAENLFFVTVTLVVSEEDVLFAVDPVESDDVEDMDFVKKLPSSLKNFRDKHIDHLKCVLCDTGAGIHNARPLAEGYCCDDCHTLVLSARLEEIRQDHFSTILVVYYKGTCIPAYESETWNVQYFTNLANQYYLKKRPNFATESDYVDSAQKSLDRINELLCQTLTIKKAENHGRSPYNVTNMEKLFDDAFSPYQEAFSHSQEATQSSTNPYVWALYVQVLLSSERIVNDDKNGYLYVDQRAENSFVVDAFTSLPVCACGKFADVALPDKSICKDCFEIESKKADENAQKLISKEKQEKKPRHVIPFKDPEKEKIKEMFRCLTPPPITKQRNASGMFIATQSQIDIALNNWKNNPNKPNHSAVFPYLNKLKLRQGKLELLPKFK
jgi:hypothetical protein